MTDFSDMPLTVVHRAKDAAGSGLPPAQIEQLSRRGFYVSTCMRELAVLPSADALRGLQLDRVNDVMHHRHAYAFLLQTITGLNSSIPGETNVQGQIRKAWNQWRPAANAHIARRLGPAMHRLFYDARTIRQEYLQGIGGSSYGSLVRKLLQPGSDARVLFIGAGELALSIMPFFSASATGIWNRHLPTDEFTPPARRFAVDDDANAAAWATHMVLTTPPENRSDSLWAERARAGCIPVVHLGRRRARAGAWRNCENFYSLDDVFELRRTQSTVRSLNIMRAQAACERAALMQISKPGPGLRALTA